jgi:hypothetical protein
MNFSLKPFPRQPREFDAPPSDEFPDIRETLATRKPLANSRTIANRDLLDVVVESLREIATPFYITHCHEAGGDLHLSVAAAGHGCQVTEGDEVRGGLYLRNSQNGRFDTLICTRLYRVVCANGMLVECEKEQSFVVPVAARPPADWQARVPQVIRRAFDEQGLRFDFGRFEATSNELLASPYEFLCSLAAQQLISDDEQSEIQAAFNDNADYSVYGLLNAVTQTAHAHRASDQWLRAFEIERLAGEILRGDHNLPALDAVSWE